MIKRIYGAALLLCFGGCETTPEPIPVVEAPVTEVAEEVVPATFSSDQDGVWLSKLALLAYLKKRDALDLVPIKLEGRYLPDTDTQFRVIYREATPQDGDYRFRMEMDENQFLLSDARVRSAGYTLVFRQDFFNQGRRRKIQAIWKR